MPDQELVGSKGLAISIHLYGTGSVPPDFKEQLEKRKIKKDQSGFLNVSKKGKIIEANYVVLFNVSLTGILENGDVGPLNYVSAEKGFLRFHEDINLLELRGTRKSANKIADIISALASINVFKIKISHEAMLELIKVMESINSISIYKMEDVSLSAVTIRGEDVINTPDVQKYIREMNGKISRIRGFISFPSGVALPVSISANGTIQIFKRGEGFYPDDLDWVIKKIFEIATANAE